MPTSGTSNCAEGGKRRDKAINNSIPANAAAAATLIFTNNAAEGANNAISSSPNAADWLAPTIEGSTNLFFSKICIIIPATAIDAPTNTMANVRGRRLIISTWLLSFRLPESKSAQ